MSSIKLIVDGNVVYESTNNKSSDSIKLEVDGNVVYESTNNKSSDSTSPPEVEYYKEYKVSPSTKIGDYYYYVKDGKYIKSKLMSKIGVGRYTEYTMENNDKVYGTLYVLKSNEGGASNQIPKTKTPRQKITQKPSPLNHLYSFENK
jgi:hypothetical protein